MQDDCPWQHTRHFWSYDLEATRFPTRFLIFNDIELKGFWLTRWLEEAGPDSEELLMDEIFSMISEGTLKTYIKADYSLEGVEDRTGTQRQTSNGKNNLQIIRPIKQLPLRSHFLDPTSSNMHLRILLIICISMKAL